MGSPPGVSADRFRERALAEARRYGSDPWVLVRELLQNARDAGASCVAFTTEHDGATARLSCRDDGRGLTFEDAQRDLFSLYSSRKRGRDAGRFGVGFWSVLRFGPERLVVRSWPRRGEPWQVAWDGALEHAQRSRPADGPPGTEVVLERPDPADLSAPVFTAAWKHARFLLRRDGRAPLAIRVDGRAVSAPLALPPPALAFRRRGLRGVVGLAAQPRVELFAKGLLVRDAATLDDLLAPGARSSGQAPPPLPGVAPHFLLDADDLDLLLSRGDARSDDALARVVGAAREELERLLDRQLARAGRRTWRARAGRAGWQAAALALAAAAAGLGAALAPRLSVPAAASPATSVPPLAARASAPWPYRDFRRTYSGPVLDVLDTAPRPVALRYEPSGAVLHLAVLRVDGFDDAGRPRIAREPAGAYRGADCATDCVAIELRAAGDSWTSLPVPTGHRLDAGSVVIDGHPTRPMTTAEGQPLVRLSEGSPVTVRYRTGRAAEPPPSLSAAPALPPALLPGVRSVRAVPRSARPEAASQWVRSRVRDAREPGLAARYAEEATRGQDFARIALELGAGDCDVQNGMVVRLLQAAGVRARLAIGYLGMDGHAVAGLHAWAEYDAGEGHWLVEDASGTEPAPAEVTPAPARAAPFPAARGASPAVTSRWMLPAGGAALATGVVALALLRRPRRTYRVAGKADVPALVRGALRHPDSFARVPALFERALIPLLRAGRISLAEAQQRASQGRLFVARHRSDLADRAASEGGRVLDASRAEGRAVADALGATDVDAWTRRMAGLRESPLLVLANRHLRRAGARFRVRAVAGLDEPQVLDLPRTREVLVDAHADWVEAATALARTRPDTAALALLERVAELLGMPDAHQATLLAPLAHRALLECEP